MRRLGLGAWGPAGAVFLAPLSLAALSEGGVFAGPARASGASAYYNGASLAREPAGWSAMAELSGLLLLDITYERDGTDPNRNEAYAPAAFTTLTPDLAFTLAAPSPWPWLRFAAGGFSPIANGARWPVHGAQRHFATSATLVTYTLLAGAVIQPLPQLAFSALAGPTYGWLEQNYAIDFGAFANSLLPAGSDLFDPEDPDLEGSNAVRAAGWSATAQLGVWVQPVDWLTFGGSLTVPRDILMRGSLHTDSAEVLQRALPNFDLAPDARVAVRYPMPWTAQAELEATLAGAHLSLHCEYIRRRKQRVIFADVTEAEPEFVEGRVVSIKGAHDDWSLGARVAQPWNETLELAARIDVHPRYLPSETVHPGNLDFTTLYAGVGARWRTSATLAMSVSYAFVYLVPFTVDTSIFNPRAPQASGLSLPSANGRYSGMAHSVVVGVEINSLVTPP